MIEIVNPIFFQLQIVLWKRGLACFSLTNEPVAMLGMIADKVLSFACELCLVLLLGRVLE